MISSTLDIVHVMRAPVGGLFRHVRDVISVQAAGGHRIGLVCDSDSGGSSADDQLEAMEPVCTHGVHRIAMSRTPGLGDASSARRIAELVQGCHPDIIHGHGAKGGAYARLACGRLSAQAIYTPHGGALHYSWRSPHGALFLIAEKLMLTRTSGLSFVCEYERSTFDSKIGIGKVPSAVIHNGLWDSEFSPVPVSADATDLVFIGELRFLKGVDTLIDVLTLPSGRPLSATIVGDGPDREAFEAKARDAGLGQRIRFTGALPAREAFALGRIMVVPSRNESFPYVVLEAVAAEKPLIATRVGGIPEVLDPSSLVRPDSPQQLADAINSVTAEPERAMHEARARAKEARSRFNAQLMGEKLVAFYRQVLSTDERVNDVA